MKLRLSVGVRCKVWIRISKFRRVSHLNSNLKRNWYISYNQFDDINKKKIIDGILDYYKKSTLSGTSF